MRIRASVPVREVKAPAHAPGSRSPGGTGIRALSDELGLPATRRRVALIKGTPARTILESAHDGRADLIVMGTSKAGGAKRLLIGSVAEQVLRDAERDILIIPADAADALSSSNSATLDAG